MTRKTILIALILAFAVVILAIATSTSFAAPPETPGGPEKVTLCHAAGQVGTLQYVTLTIAYPAAYGPAGHFYENGTPRAGHENDHLGPCTCEEDPDQEFCEPPPEVCEEPGANNIGEPLPCT
ncbi:hypothetical protein ACFL1M_03810, partial [Patescibacteria group bacterium]